MRLALVAGPAAGHAFPIIGLAGRLRDAGHEILIACGTQWQVGIEREGHRFVELPWLPPSEHDEDFGYRLWGIPRGMAPLLADLLEPWSPDALVSDTLTSVGGFTAGLMGLRWAELIPHPLQDMSESLPPPGTGLEPGVTEEEKQRDSYLRHHARKSLALAQHQRTESLRALGLPDDHAADVRLVATMPALEVQRPDWPADAVVVGPIEWDPSSVALDPPPGDEPLVFLSASTMSDVGLLDIALDVLEGTGVRMVSTQFEPYVGSLPSWAAIGPGRQDALIRASSVVLSGAGHGIIAKALMRGKPLVVVPGEGEQRDNATRLQRLGVAEMVEAWQLDPADVRTAVEKVLADAAYATRAVEAAAVTTCSGGALQDPVAVIERVL